MVYGTGLQLFVQVNNNDDSLVVIYISGEWSGTEGNLYISTYTYYLITIIQYRQYSSPSHFTFQIAPSSAILRMARLI